MHFDATTLAITTAVLLLAGFVKGVIGLGLPAISMGLLGVMMPPLQAAALLVVPNLVTNLWQLAAGGDVRPVLRRLWPMLAGIAVGTGLGVLMLPVEGARWATPALGAMLALYALLGLLHPALRLPERHERWAGPFAGMLTGIATVATGVFVIPTVPYLQALGFSRAALVQALGLSFLTSAIALAPALAGTGAFGVSSGGWSLLALAPALAGMFAGQAMRERITQETFRRSFFSGLLLLGAYLASKALA